MDIVTKNRTGPTGDVEQVREVEFTTENTSGTHTIEIPKDEFDPELARRRAREEAEKIDAAFETEEE